MKTELKPCPFCGKPGTIVVREYKFTSKNGFIPCCSNGSCLCSTMRKEYRTEEGARSSWNRRKESVDDKR